MGQKFLFTELSEYTAILLDCIDLLTQWSACSVHMYEYIDWDWFEDILAQYISPMNFQSSMSKTNLIQTALCDKGKNKIYSLAYFVLSHLIFYLHTSFSYQSWDSKNLNYHNFQRRIGQKKNPIISRNTPLGG